MPQPDYEAEDFCPHCGEDTLHRFKDGGHERDSSNDRKECLVCHWWNLGMSSEYHPPMEADND